MDLKAYIREVPDFPTNGILFRDITPLLGNPEALHYAVARLQEHAAPLAPTAIVGIESRGFLFGAALADRMSLPFVPVRKPGKLPAARMTIEYSLEYGENQLDIHEDALPGGGRAYVVDDLLATGGTAMATSKLVEMIGGTVAALGFVIELRGLGGRERLGGYEIFSVVEYE